MISLLLVVQVPDASNVCGVTVLLRPLDGFLLRLAGGEDVVRMVLNYVVGDVSALLPTLGAGLDLHDSHLSLLVSATQTYSAVVGRRRTATSTSGLTMFLVRSRLTFASRASIFTI